MVLSGLYLAWQFIGVPKKTTPTDPLPSSSVTLNFWGVYDDSTVFQPIIDAYEAAHPGVTVVYTPKDPALYEFASLNLLAAQDGPDVWLIPQEWLPKHRDKLSPVPDGLLASQEPSATKRRGLFAKKPQPLPNATLYKNRYTPVTQTENIVDNTVYSVPLSADTLGLFGNAALLQEKGVTRLPQTWDEVIDASNKLRERDGVTLKKPGIALGTSKNVARADEILAVLLMQNHTPTVNEEKTEARYNETITKATGEPFQAGLTALDFYTSFASPSKENFAWTANEAPDFEQFLAGKLPLMIDYSFRVRDITDTVPTFPLATGIMPQIRGTDLPTTLATPLVVGVPSVSKNPTVAWNFIQFLTNKDNSLTYALASGRPPARLDLIQGQGFSPYLTPFLAQVNAEKNKPVVASLWYRNEINTIRTVFHQAIDTTLAGEPLQTVIDRLTSQVTRILRGEPYE